MRGPTTFQIVGRCRNCYGDSPKACKREQIQPMFDSISEYQWAYRKFLAQPKPPKSKKPVQKGIDIHENWRSKAERKSMYSKDFQCPTLPKRVIPFKHKQQTEMPTQKFDGTTEYSMVYYPKKAYPAYGTAAMLASNPYMIKAKDNLKVSEGHMEGKSVAQGDFVPHEDAERPAAILPKENTPRPTEPIAQSTEYKDSFSCKPAAEPQISRIPDISTTMADYTEPKDFERPKPCQPPEEAYVLDPLPFEGTTMSRLAYRAFPVKRYELPIWAKKPPYKRHEGGMLKTSVYRNEFLDPGVFKPPAPYKPKPGNPDFLRHFERCTIEAESKPKSKSMYKGDFQLWENVRPRTSYKIKEKYEGPTEKMICESDYKSYYTGVKAEKLKPCRHISEHRGLNVDGPSYYITTYEETYQNLFSRPKTTPAPKGPAHVPVKERPGSAKPLTPLLPNPPSIPKKIPSPEWKVRTIEVPILDQCTDHTKKIPTPECKDHTKKIPTLECKDKTNKIPTLECKDQTNKIPTAQCKDQTNKIPTAQCEDQTNKVPTAQCKDQTNKIPTIESEDQTSKISTPVYIDHTGHLIVEKTPIRAYREPPAAKRVTKTDFLKIHK